MISDALRFISDSLKKIGIISERFFGKIVLQFEDGKIVLIRKEETIKP